MVRATGPHTMTTTRCRRTRAGRPRGQFTSDRPIPPSTSWWVGVSRAEWRAAVAALAPDGTLDATAGGVTTLWERMSRSESPES